METAAEVEAVLEREASSSTFHVGSLVDALYDDDENYYPAVVRTDRGAVTPSRPR